MNVLKKLVSLITQSKKMEEQMDDQQVLLQSVKLIVTRGIFISSYTDSEFRAELFLFGRDYVEIRLGRNGMHHVQVTFLTCDSQEMEKYLQEVGIGELLKSSMKIN